MNSFLDQLNLTPQERRIVVGIGVIVFILLNLLLVWPHFSDLGRTKQELADTRAKIIKYNKAIEEDIETNNGYKVQLAKLQSQQGGGVGAVQIQLQRTVGEEAIKSGVNVSDVHPVNSPGNATNQFYEEQSVKITFDSLEDQLVSFLVNIGNDPAMIRVREITLKTADANRYRLRGEALLTANYAKQTVVAPKTAAPGAKQKPPELSPEDKARRLGRLPPNQNPPGKKL